MHTGKRMEQRGPGGESMVIHIGHKMSGLDLQPKLGRGEVPQRATAFCPRINQGPRQGSGIYRSSKHVSAVWGT